MPVCYCGNTAEFALSWTCGTCANKPPQFWLDHLKHIVEENRYYRNVVFTTAQMQLVVMNITMEDGGIEEEIHPGTTQFFCVVEGEGFLITDRKVAELYYSGDAFIVPAGLRHELRHSGDEPLKLYTIYSPPQHPEGYVKKRRYE